MGAPVRKVLGGLLGGNKIFQPREKADSFKKNFNQKIIFQFAPTPQKET